MVTTVLHQWDGRFSGRTKRRRFLVISWGRSTCAALSKATKVIVKTPHEAIGVPTKEANAQGLSLHEADDQYVCDQRLSNTSHVVNEMMIISAETRCIVDKCIELGNGDLAVGVVRHSRPV